MMKKVNPSLIKKSITKSISSAANLFQRGGITHSVPVETKLLFEKRKL